MMRKWQLVAILFFGIALGLFLGKYYDGSYSVAQSSEERVKMQQELLAFKDASKPFITVVKFVQPSVVSISTKKTLLAHDDDFFWNFFRRSPQAETMQIGSGVIVDEKGYILTNAHVVQGADEIKVSLLDGREVIGKVIGSDSMTDLAVVKITTDKLTSAMLGDSDKVEVGEMVVAIGSPFGLGNTVTSGIISAKRDLASSNISGDYSGFIQTDAAINPGNSGGPLVALTGQVIGINSAIISRSGGYQGIGFAIPINRAKYIMNKLIEKGRVARPFLGVQASPIDKALAISYGLDGVDDLLKHLKMAKPEGVFVLRVVPGSDAEKSGLLEGDVIMEIESKKIETPEDITKVINKKNVGDDINIKIIRNGKEQSIKASIGERQ
ncbi:MAG: trypsin-like peptidase domain-containing protein [Candidatus Brocadiia bacterium]